MHADLHAGGAHGVVLAPGGRFDKESWSAQARALVDAGFTALAIDFRDEYAREEDLRFDVLAAFEHLRARGCSPISIVGASYGGWAAALASAELDDGELDALVLFAASSVDAPERMTGRKLFLVTRDDFQGEGTLRLPDIESQFARARDPKRLVVLDGNAHAQHVFATDGGAEALAVIVAFLRGDDVPATR